ncbi:Phosphate import ATP-binding protein PstB [Vibrio stylophorae]|uniref:Phosphate import ATP-binding protein PstB n=1 Tax=Vibrio stylophorae TaxID=659351 RepID=A0ABN8DXZ5_9VIBR|nr:phosphate ABC transporter ATP-binding protein [Vibrio stylophorae]CAH0535298.1 Phosphate import ATP-binding protein PstB [Vibrio stylophorae]
MSAHVIVRDLSLAFGKHQVLQGIDANFEANRIHVLVGPSGSGKSSFLRSLNRLNEVQTPASSFSGEIWLETVKSKTAIHQLKDNELPWLRQQMGMVFQHPQLLPGSIADNVLLPLKVVRGLTGEAAQQAMQDALEQAALWQDVAHRLDVNASSLSGGQQQRLCLARTLALSPTVLLLDEPTASLDPTMAAQIEDLFLTLRQRYTMIVVSHQPQQSIKLADHLYCFEQGQMRELPKTQWHSFFSLKENQRD